MKIIVVGLGHDWKECKELIMQQYDVVALSDNFYSNTITKIDRLKYIPLAKLENRDGIKFLISSFFYYWQIRLELIEKVGIKKEAILDEYVIQEIRIAYKRSKSTREEEIEKYKADREEYIRLEKNSSHLGNWRFMEQYQIPFLGDGEGTASAFPNFYFWMEEWCSKKIYAAKPKVHVDIGGRYDGFIGRLNTFGQRVKQVDIRSMTSPCKNVEFICSDATNLAGFHDNSVSSLSAMGIIENTGFGRWNDPVDPDAWYKCLMSIQRVLCKNADFYLCVPIGKEILEFNARRVFEPLTILRVLDKLKLVEFAIIDPTGKSGYYLSEGYTEKWIKENYVVEENKWNRQIRGCFWFKKK